MTEPRPMTEPQPMTAASSTGQHSLVSSVVWNVVQFGAGRFVAFAVTLLLARVLVPQDFGLLALGLLALGVFDRLKDIGVGAGLVQRPGPWSRLAPTGLTLSAGGAVGLAGVCGLLAPQIAALLGDEELVGVLRVLAISLAINGASVLPDAALRRRLLFRQRTIPELSGAVVKGGVSLALALAGHGVYSLAWGQVAGAATITVGYWIVYSRQGFARIRLGWDRPVVGSLLTYGGQLAWVALLSLLLDNLDYLVIGRRLGAEQLGFYTMAFRLPELLVISVCAVVGEVLFSSFSTRAGDNDGLSRQFLSATGAIACLTVPVGAGLSAAAPDLVPALLGGSFGPSVQVLQLLGLYAVVYSLTFHAGELYKATGKAHILVWLSLAKLVVFAPVLWWAAGRSITAVAAAVLGLHVVFALVRAAIVRRQLDVRVGAQVRAVVAPVVSGLVMWVVVVLVGARLPLASHVGRLVLLAGVGVVVYLGALMVLDRSVLSGLRGLSPWAKPAPWITREDRLSGLAVLCSVVTGVPRVHVRGARVGDLDIAVGSTVALVDEAGPEVGVVLAATSEGDAVAALADVVRPGRPAVVWVLWPGQSAARLRRAAVRTGLVEVAAYRYVGSATSPTHLVREGSGQAVRWFAAAVRPQWGRNSRLATRANRLPVVGHRFFDGRAMVFRAPSCVPVWPGATTGQPAGPAVLHLGGGPTAGRLVLTWADAVGRPTHHTKVAPAHRAAGLRAEAEALRALAAEPGLSGSVPPLAGFRDEPNWCALTAGHVDGLTPADDAASPGTADSAAAGASRSALPDVDSLVTDWLVDLADVHLATTSSFRGVPVERVHEATASFVDADLRATVHRGLQLAAGCVGLLHGDLWPGNVHLVPRGARPPRGVRPLAVLDWESALAGHPLVDLLTWLVNRAGPGSQIRAGARAALGSEGATGVDGRLGTAAAGHVERLLRAIGGEDDPGDVEALVLAQMVVIAVAGGPAHGDGRHEKDWLDAVRTVWTSWQDAGGSPWSARSVGRQVAR